MSSTQELKRLKVKAGVVQRCVAWALAPRVSAHHSGALTHSPPLPRERLRRRIVKDLNLTKAEIAAQAAKVEKMKAEQGDIYDIRKQVRKACPPRAQGTARLASLSPVCGCCAARAHRRPFPPPQEEVLAECTSARPLDEERLEKAIDDLAKTVADVREGPEFDDLKVTCAVRPGSRRTPGVIPPPSY